MFVFGVLAIELWPTDMPVWALVLALVCFVIHKVDTLLIPP